MCGPLPRLQWFYCICNITSLLLYAACSFQAWYALFSFLQFLSWKKKLNLTIFLGFLEIRQPLADGWWYTSRLTGYLRKFMAFPARGSHLRPLDLTKTAAWIPRDTHPLLYTWSLHSRQIWSSWGASDIRHMCCINRNLSLGFLEQKSESARYICSRYSSGC